MKKKKHKLLKDSDMEEALNDMNNAIKEKYGDVENYRPWIANWKKNISMQVWCSVCPRDKFIQTYQINEEEKIKQETPR